MVGASNHGWRLRVAKVHKENSKPGHLRMASRAHKAVCCGHTSRRRQHACQQEQTKPKPSDSSLQATHRPSAPRPALRPASPSPWTRAARPGQRSCRWRSARACGAGRACRATRALQAHGRGAGRSGRSLAGGAANSRRVQGREKAAAVQQVCALPRHLMSGSCGNKGVHHGLALRHPAAHLWHPL